MKWPCKRCKRPVHQSIERALNGEWAMVWADEEGEWVCPVNKGDEHIPNKTPGEPHERTE